MEDLQNIDTHSFRHVHGIFNYLMESGRLIRSMYGEVNITVEAALLCDANPKSTNRPSLKDKAILFHEDLNIPIISRVRYRHLRRENASHQMLEPAFEHVSDWKQSPDAPRQRQQRIKEHYAGRTVEIGSLCEIFPTVQKRTVLRDLHELGAKQAGNGLWRIPA